MTTNDYRINWQRLAITQEGEGTIVHPLIALALTPIIGLVFLMFLPFIGFYLSVQALGLKIKQVINHTTSIPAPVVGAAYLAGHEEDGQKDESLDELYKEIQSRRGE